MTNVPPPGRFFLAVIGRSGLGSLGTMWRQASSHTWLLAKFHIGIVIVLLKNTHYSMASNQSYDLKLQSAGGRNKPEKNARQLAKWWEPNHGSVSACQV
jgi:hypothetical protein